MCIMEKCYIAGKIGNLPEREYKRNFDEAVKEVKTLGYDPVSPIDLPHDHDKAWSSYMKEDIKAMLNCDAVYCLSNWQNSKGAKIEIELAISLGLKVIFQENYYSKTTQPERYKTCSG